MNQSDTPQFVHPADNLVPASDHLQRLMEIPPSRMFLIKNSLKAFRETHPGEATYDASQGDGGASLPGVPKDILERALQKQIERGTSYDMPFGTESFRRSVIEDYWQVDSSSGLTPQNVVGTVGGRDALVKAYAAMLALGYGRQGDVILVSRVPWISYNWGPYGIGANVLRAPGRPEDGWAYTADSIRESVAYAEKHGRKVAGLIITNPDNPTGRTISAEAQVQLARSALEAGVAFVLFDWIYHYVTDEAPMDLNEIMSMFSAEERERIMFLDGLTKSLGGSNIRNAHLIAPKRVVDFIVARASHTVVPTYFGMAVAESAYEMGFREATRTIVEPTSASRKVLRSFIEKHRLEAILGQGYYTFVNVQRWLDAAGWKDSEALSEYLGREHGLAVVPGVYSSEDGAGWIRFSYATPPEVTQGALERLLQGLKTLE